VLADDLTDLVHSVADRQAASQAAAALFGGGELRDLPAEVLAAVAAEVKAAQLDARPDLTLVEALVSAGVVASKSAARRAIAEGGAYLNNVRLEDADQRLTAADLLPGGYAVLRRGRKTVGMVRVNGSALERLQLPVDDC
jgi:tyrosyl-tRNA synthetase